MTRLMLLLVAAPLAAQQAPTRPALWLVPKGDTVLVYLTETPVSGGFVVYRGVPGGARVMRTAAPVVRERQPAMAAGMMGTDLPTVMRAVRAVDEGEMLRRLSSDRFAADVLSFMFRGVALVLGRVYVDAGATRGAEYEYRVVFTGPDGAETDRTLTARVRVADVTPVAPTQVRTTAGDREMSLTWSFPAYRGSPADQVLGFHVYRADGAAGEYRRLTPTPIIRNDASPFAFRDQDITNGVAYRYRMTAVDVAGRESVPSVPAAVTPRDNTPPAIATDLAAREGDGVVYVTWRLAPEADIAGYYVERAPGLHDRFERLNRALIPPQQPAWTDTVAGGLPYFYRVVAVDAAGNASPPSNALATLPVDKTPPAPPSGVTVTVAQRKLTVQWTASPSRGIRGYYVYRGDAPERLVRLMRDPVIGTRYADSGYAGKGLNPGDGYVIEVSALDSSFNESVKVRALIAIPDDDPPGPPTAFQVKNAAGRYADVQWTGSNALDVSAYELTRAAGNAPPVIVARFTARDRAYRDTTAVHGGLYVYRLVARDSAGNTSVPAMDSLAFRDFTAPPPPRRADARLTAAGVEITWERVVAQELVGYHVYRSDLPTGVFQRLTTTPVSALVFTDPRGRAGLFYVIRAIDRSGNESSKSPVADVVRP